MVHSVRLLVLQFKFILVCVLVATDIFLVMLLLGSLRVVAVSPSSENVAPPTKETRIGTNRFDKNLQSTARSIGTRVANTAKTIGNTTSSALHIVSNTASGVVEGVATTISNPTAIIKPDQTDALPEIKVSAEPNPETGQQDTAITFQPTSEMAAREFSSDAVWPLHGRVTTEFGVYHQPFQPWHTGIDISSPSFSRAPITPFREGMVVDIIYSSYSLGNHVVIDHGEGLTSYYGHLSSITVKKGQTVKPGNIVGYEGSTGASTGPHLHFEIRQNGKPLNPRQFITGNP